MSGMSQQMQIDAAPLTLDGPEVDDHLALKLAPHKFAEMSKRSWEERALWKDQTLSTWCPPHAWNPHSMK